MLPAVKVPQELLGVRPTVLEVRPRLGFAPAALPRRRRGAPPPPRRRSPARPDRPAAPADHRARRAARPPPRARQEYVRHRLLQFMTGLSLRLRSLSPGADLGLLDRAAAEALQALPPPDYGHVPIEMLELQLVFRHDCQ
jgi:hypothetical protein